MGSYQSLCFGLSPLSAYMLTPAQPDVLPVNCHISRCSIPVPDLSLFLFLNAFFIPFSLETLLAPESTDCGTRK